jgi:hypothetical protein
MAGLDNIPKYEDGGEVVVTPPAVKGQANIAGKVPLDPTETANILNQMQKLVDERTGPMAQFLGGLKDATAWTGGGAQGPTEALATRNIQKRAEQQELLGLQSQMAAYRGAQTQNELAKKTLENIGSGQGIVPGVAGTATQHSKLMNDPNIQLRMAALPAWDAQGRLDILSDAAKTEFGYKAKGAYEAAGNKPDTYPIPGIGPGGKTGLVTMTANEYIEFKATGRLPDGRVVPQSVVAAAPAAPSTAATPSAATPQPDSAAARVAQNESGSTPGIGYHDVSKGSAYGTYGITKAAYQDIQAANPKFQNRPITSLTPAEQTEAFNTYRQLSGNRLSQLGIETSPQNLDLAHFLGADGAARFLKTGQISNAAAAANGGVEKATAIAQSLLGGKPTAVSPATQQTAPLPPHPSTIKPVTPIGQVPVAKSLAPNEAIVQPAAPAAPAPAPAPAPAAAPAAPAPVVNDPQPTYEQFGNVPEFTAATEAWKNRQAERAKGLGTASTETAKNDADKKNEYRNSLDTSQKTFDEYDRLFRSSKGHEGVFNLAGQSWYGPLAAKITPKLETDRTEHHAMARTWLNDESKGVFDNIDQGAATAQAAWAKTLVTGAGGRLTNADLALGKPAKGVGIETTYSSHMKNLAENMQEVRTAYYRSKEFQKWEAENPNGTAAQFELTPYYQVGSKVDAARDVAEKFASVPESGYVHKDKNGRNYVIINGKGVYL